MTGTAASLALGGAQVAFVVLGAPLLQGVVRTVKARVQSRSGPPLLQSYFDLAKLFSRSEIHADSATAIQAIAPWVVLGSTLAAALFIPMFAAATPLTRDGDLLVVIGLFALGRAALTLGGIDSGSAFGQMGSSRELAVGALVEPALLLSLASLALAGGTTRLDEVVAIGAGRGPGFIDVQWALGLTALAVVTLAETGRIPVDNPDTHLELTMIHEAMLIEYSGRSLGALHWAAMMKQLLLACLIANLFVPFGLHRDPDFGSWLAGGAMLVGKLGAVGLALAVVESVFAKMRLYELPDLLGSASLAALLAMAITVWQL
jgi:formate hydrogenlyase subunit 4